MSFNVFRGALLAAAASASFLVAAPAHAGPVPYPTPGVQNLANYSFTAAAAGDIVAYFYGSSAAYVNELRLLVNGVDTGIQGLNTTTSAIGTMLNFGTVSAGDVLVFMMVNLSPGGVGPWYSDKSLNSDGVQHIYATDFAGAGTVPAGTYVAFEDLPGGGDFSYRDQTFVFTNVATSVPEPGSLALLAVAALGAFGAARRRAKTGA